jgi:hypothetical protein
MGGSEAGADGKGDRVSWLDRRVDLRALVGGVAADWLGTLLTAGLLGAAFGVGPETDESRLAELVAAPEFLLAATIHGTFFTAVGGYVAGRLAPSDELRHAVIVGLLSLVMAALIATTPGGGPRPAWWFDVVGYLLAVPAAAAGGWLAQRREDPGRRRGGGEAG